MADAKSPPSRRRSWIDALVATALRWNDRLSRPVGDDAKPSPDPAPGSAGIRVASVSTTRPAGTARAK
jgi:hypothetical protein